jgi:hypothetical protein
MVPLANGIGHSGLQWGKNDERCKHTISAKLLSSSSRLLDGLIETAIYNYSILITQSACPEPTSQHVLPTLLSSLRRIGCPDTYRQEPFCFDFPLS